jgi:hypothetical protein
LGDKITDCVRARTAFTPITNTLWAEVMRRFFFVAFLKRTIASLLGYVHN